MTLPSPFDPLVAGGGGLGRYPGDPKALRERMARLHGLDPERVLVTRGASHGLELAWRWAARNGVTLSAPDGAPYDRLDALYRLGTGAAPGVVVLSHSDDVAASFGDRLLTVLDEGALAFAAAPEVAPRLAERNDLVILRSLSLGHGLAGARIGAALGSPDALARLASVLEPHALPEPSVRLALDALDPSRDLATAERMRAVQAEIDRVARALDGLAEVRHETGPRLTLTGAAASAWPMALSRADIAHETTDQGLRVAVMADPPVNDRLLAALGAPVASPRPDRTAQVVRDTAETRIACLVALDRPAPVHIRTGNGFFDHMLEQVAAHGGFSLVLECEGDLHTDPHHTIEDCAIALGQALKQALGDRRGIARYGFVLPMDEALAQVSIDLSGRPYPVFEGRFDTPFIGDYRTDLTAHVFRSLAEHLGAAIHVTVTGQDDHHKTEACYKALGRALRQAIRVEGGAVPSTKGVL